VLLNGYVFRGENKADLEGVKIQTGVLLNGTGIKKALPGMARAWFAKGLIWLAAGTGFT
jgi:hypothetical protein